MRHATNATRNKYLLHCRLVRQQIDSNQLATFVVVATTRHDQPKLTSVDVAEVAALLRSDLSKETITTSLRFAPLCASRCSDSPRFMFKS